MRHSFLLIAMISVSLEPKWRHFAQVNIADIFMLSSKLPKQNEISITSIQIFPYTTKHLYKSVRIFECTLTCIDGIKNLMDLIFEVAAKCCDIKAVL